MSKKIDALLEKIKGCQELDFTNKWISTTVDKMNSAGRGLDPKTIAKVDIWDIARLMPSHTYLQCRLRSVPSPKNNECLMNTVLVIDTETCSLDFHNRQSKGESDMVQMTILKKRPDSDIERFKLSSDFGKGTMSESCACDGYTLLHHGHVCHKKNSI